MNKTEHLRVSKQEHSIAWAKQVKGTKWEVPAVVVQVSTPNI